MPPLSVMRRLYFLYLLLDILQQVDPGVEVLRVVFASFQEFFKLAGELRLCRKDGFLSGDFLGGSFWSDGFWSDGFVSDSFWRDIFGGLLKLHAVVGGLRRLCAICRKILKKRA